MSEAEEKEPSGGRATLIALAARRQTQTSAAPISFNRQELNEILEVYGRKVADGEWRDYAIDQLARAGGLLDLPPRLRNAALPDRQAAEAGPPPGRLFAGRRDRR